MTAGPHCGGEVMPHMRSAAGEESEKVRKL